MTQSRDQHEVTMNTERQKDVPTADQFYRSARRATEL